MGYSFVDLKQLMWKHIITEEDGSLWISMSRQKTDISFSVKLLDIPIRIIEKYKEISGTGKNNTVFKVLSHRRISDVLKTIAKHCDITKNVSFHVARHKGSRYWLLVNQLHHFRFSIGNDLETSFVLRYA